jgi:OOP family OmpA-OmpF porin
MRSTDANLKTCRRPLRHPELTTCAVGLAFCLAALFAGKPAAAHQGAMRFNIETAAGFWVDKPQMTRFTPGFYVALRPGVALGRIVSLQMSFAMLVTPAKSGYSDLGMAHFIMPGLRIRPFATLRPRTEQLGGLFVDFNAGYVRTGDLNRFGFDAGIGYDFQVAPSFALGPVVRYVQIVQPNDDRNRDPNDAQMITVGLDFAFGPAHREKPVDVYRAREECAPAPACVQKAVVAEKCCADKDRDGTCDVDDRCPMDPGPAATMGCPIDPCSGKPLLVLVQFKYDSSEMPRQREDDPQVMDPVLDAVAAAIAQDPSCRVCIIGHASEEGPADYNQTLSAQRATAVQGYLAKHGLIEKRIPAIGLGKRCQLIPEATRPENRRVEFRRLQDDESCPTDCSR